VTGVQPEKHDLLVKKDFLMSFLSSVHVSGVYVCTSVCVSLCLSVCMLGFCMCVTRSARKNMPFWKNLFCWCSLSVMCCHTVTCTVKTSLLLSLLYTRVGCIHPEKHIFSYKKLLFYLSFLLSSLY